MQGMRGPVLRVGVVVCAALAVTAGAHEGPPRVSSTLLSHPRVSELPDGRVVISMAARGDLPGQLTLTLERAADPGTISGGEWALVVTRVIDDGDDDDGHGRGSGDHARRDDEREERERGGSPHDDTAPHQELIRIVDLGTLAGRVIGGRLRAARRGGLWALEDVVLEVDSGSLELQGLSGEGSLAARALTTPEASGELRLRLGRRP